MNAIGLDVSKATFHAALDDERVEIVRNSGDGIAGFLARLKEVGCTPEDTSIGVKATGVYHLNVCLRLSQSLYRVRIINPLQSYKFSQAQSHRPPQGKSLFSLFDFFLRRKDKSRTVNENPPRSRNPGTGLSIESFTRQ